MHEQNFEKQVQQKMEVFSLQPSAPVWQKVEEQIQKKKDRRRVLFWLFPLLVVGGSTYWLLSGSGPSLTPGSSAHVQKQQPAAASNQRRQQTQTETAEQTIPGKNEPDASLLTTPGTISSNHTPTTGLLSNNYTLLPSKSQKQDKTSLPAAQDQYTDRETVTAVETAELASDLNGHNWPVTNIAVSGLASTVAGTEVYPAPGEALTEVNLADLDSAMVSQAATAKSNKHRKWEWAVHVEGGITSVQSYLIPMPSTRDAFASPSQGTSGLATTTSSSMDNGLAFAGGLTIKRAISGRAKITAGIQYNFHSTRMKVGQEIAADTVLVLSNRSVNIGNHYRPGSQQDYQNAFHFIHLPVGIEYRLLRKVPLHLQAGASLAQLINANALLYDYGANIYYKNYAAFNKTQIYLFTNLTYTVFNIKGKRIHLGPYAQYGLTELQKGSGEKNRLFSAGLRTQVSF
jgi:hypothetical protein